MKKIIKVPRKKVVASPRRLFQCFFSSSEGKKTVHRNRSKQSIKYRIKIIETFQKISLISNLNMSAEARFLATKTKNKQHFNMIQED